MRTGIGREVGSSRSSWIESSVRWPRQSNGMRSHMCFVAKSTTCDDPVRASTRNPWASH